MDAISYSTANNPIHSLVEIMFCYDRPFMQTSKPAKQRRRTVRQIQEQLDSLRTRERASLTRNSGLLADISRLKKQVQNMNVSVNRLERARDYYDRYVETCMVNWIQKSFRETGTEKRVGSSLEEHPSPTKNIGVQTTHDLSTTQISDWSISPDSERRLIPPMQSTLIIPNAATQLPPRDTRPHTDTSSCLPPVINFSDLLTPSVPLQDTFAPQNHILSAYYPEQSTPAVMPSSQAPYASPLPIGLPPYRPLVPRMLPPGTTYVHTNAFHNVPNVSMIAPHPYLAVPQSYAWPQQPAVYPNPPISPTIPTPRHSIDTSLPLSAMPPDATQTVPQQRELSTGIFQVSVDTAPLSHIPAEHHSPFKSHSKRDTPESSQIPPTRPLEDSVLPAATFHTSQPLRHSDTIPTQNTKSVPPPPRHSFHSPSKQVVHSPEPQLSHSRQSSTLPTIPEPRHETPEFTPQSVPLSDTQPPNRSASDTPVGMRRVPSAYEFALHHLDNLERRATLDLGDRSSSEAGPHRPNHSLDSREQMSYNHKSDTDVESNGSERDRFSHLKSTPNQFDLTALLVSESGSEEELLRHKPSQVMSESPSGLTVLRTLAASLNSHCTNTALSATTKLYDPISATDTFKPQIAESNVVVSKILFQADTSDVAQLATWDVHTLGAVYLSEVSKYVHLTGPILTPEIINTPHLDLDTFNRMLPLGSQEVWNVLVGHFVSLFEARYSVEEISATFATHLVKPLSPPESVELASRVLAALLNEMLVAEASEKPEPTLSSSSSSDLNSEPVREEVYQQLLKSVAVERVDRGVKSGEEVDSISIPSSLGIEGPVGQFEAGAILMPPGPTAEEQSPTQLLDEAVGEKIQSDESSGSESVEEADIYLPSFGPPKPMSDRERKTKFEKFWGSDLDSDESDVGQVAAVKKKPSSGLDDFDFF